MTCKHSYPRITVLTDEDRDYIAALDSIIQLDRAQGSEKIANDLIARLLMEIERLQMIVDMPSKETP